MTLLAKEEKRMLEKVSVAVQRLLRRLDDRWTGREVSQATGVAHSRISEYRDYDKYQRPISLNHLIKFIRKGFFTMQDVIDVTEGLDVNEQEFLLDLGFYENTTLRRLVIKMKRDNNLDPLELYNGINTLTDNGVNVKELLGMLVNEGVGGKKLLCMLIDKGVDVKELLDVLVDNGVDVDKLLDSFRGGK